MTNSIVRMVGIIERGPRGLLLQTVECGRWRLLYEEEIDHLVGSSVLVEGTRKGAAITAYFVGPVPEQGA